MFHRIISILVTPSWITDNLFQATQPVGAGSTTMITPFERYLCPLLETVRRYAGIESSCFFKNTKYAFPLQLFESIKQLLVWSEETCRRLAPFWIYRCMECAVSRIIIVSDSRTPLLTSLSTLSSIYDRWWGFVIRLVCYIWKSESRPVSIFDLPIAPPRNQGCDDLIRVEWCCDSLWRLYIPYKSLWTVAPCVQYKPCCLGCSSRKALPKTILSLKGGW